jgi:hypothetical protein
MPDRSDEQKPESRETPQDKPTRSEGKKRGIPKYLILAAVVVGCATVAYKIGVRVGSTVPDLETASISSPAFNRGPSDNLFSPSNLLKVVGQSPADPSKVLFPTLERSLDPQSEKKPKACPPAPLAASMGSGPVAVAAQKTPDHRSDSDGAGPRPVDTPVIETKQPLAMGTSDREGTGSGQPLSEPLKQGGHPEQMATTPTEGPKKQDRKQHSTPGVVPTKAADQEDRSKNEQFQLPGSMAVRIPDYAGTVAKWGLMVILDDSASMGRKNRVWNGSRLKAGQSAIEKVTEIAPPGSKVAVRDFQCKKGTADAKGKESPCLSRMAIDWAELPSSAVKEKLENLSPGGKTNPCAAALYSLRNDFESHGNLTPRILIVTDGAGKCAPADVMKMAEHTIGKDRVPIDVIAIGMAKRKGSGYSSLAKKTNGMFLKLEGPGDVEQALARYAKTLKNPIKEKVEIRGEKAVFSAAPEEEITLTPGTYSVVLPLVAGIKPAKRTIPNVKVSSGEAVVFEVKVNKKGRVSVTRSGKKAN